MKALLTFLPLFRQRSTALVLALVLSLVTIVSGVALLGTSGWFITATALTTAGLAFNLFVPSAMVRGFSFLRILARYGERLVGHNATLQLLSDLRGWLFTRLFPRLPLPHRSLRHGDLVSRLTADIDALDTAFLVAVGPLAAAVVVGSGMTVLLAVLLPAAALPYGLSLIFATFAIPAAMVALGRKTGRASVTARSDMRLAVLDGTHGHADLTLLGRLGTIASAFADASSVAGRHSKRLGLITALGGLGVQLMAALALTGTLWAGLLAMESGQIDGPLMAGLLLAVLGSFEVTSVIVRSTGKATQAMAAAERLVALTDLPPAIAEPTDPLPLSGGSGLDLNAVTYGYPGLPPVLDQLSLTIRPGERIAILGASGSGKTTLLRLLLRQADLQSGTIHLGGVDISACRSGDIHKQMALLSQDSPVFDDTIRNNLLIGRSDADDAALWLALEKAHIGEHIRSLPKGLDTVIGESGRTFSAGQARRLCLARALVSKAPILLLDEPTDALDRETELAFFRDLPAASEGRTVIMVTHAILPEDTVDRALMLKNGRLS